MFNGPSGALVVICLVETRSIKPYAISVQARGIRPRPMCRKEASIKRRTSTRAASSLSSERSSSATIASTISAKVLPSAPVIVLPHLHSSDDHCSKLSARSQSTFVRKRFAPIARAPRPNNSIGLRSRQCIDCTLRQLQACANAQKWPPAYGHRGSTPASL